MPKLAPDAEQPRRGSMDVLYNSDEFRMYCFKVLPCSKHYSHDWTVCPFAHPGEKARRRDPRVFKYAGVECPHVKEGLKCPRGDLCPFAHNIFECWLHPTRYRTQLCNEPASCKRKVCFFAHALEELREPSNPIESLPEGGIGSGTAPFMSLDGLGTSNAFAGLMHRHSVDVASLQHMNGLVASSPLNLANLVPNLGVQDPAQQNQQLTQLLINLLAEIDLNGQQQQQLAKAQQMQQEAALQNIHGTPGSLQRWSTDGSVFQSYPYSTFSSSLQGNPNMMQMPAVMSTLRTPHDALMGRNASMDCKIRDALTQGSSCHGRVSIDNAALSMTFINPPLNFSGPLQTSPVASPNDFRKSGFQSIIEDQQTRNSEEASTVASFGDTSTDSRAPESYPAHYPIDGSEMRSSIDCTLPESFILF